MEIISVRLKELKELDYFGKLLNEKRSEVVRNLVQEGKKLKAIELFKHKKVSLGLASKLSGVTLRMPIILGMERSTSLPRTFNVLFVEKPLFCIAL